MSELSLIKFAPKKFFEKAFYNEYNFSDWYMFLTYFLTRTPTEPRDRTGNLTSPYNIDSNYTSPIPTDLSNTKTISECMENKASELEKLAEDKYIDVFLTGGFDSTAMYAALLKVCDNSKIRAVFQSSDEEWSISSKSKKTFNQINTELYNYIIDNKHNYRLLDLSSTIHTDDSISVLGHPGNFITNQKFLMIDEYRQKSNKYFDVKINLIDKKYDDEPWEKLVTDLANQVDICDTSKVIEEFDLVFKSCPVSTNDPYIIIWWLNYVFSYSDRIFGPWYLLKNLSLERANKIYPFFDSEDFQKYMLNVCLQNKEYITPAEDGKSRNSEIRSYMVDFYKNENIVTSSEETGPANPDHQYSSDGKPVIGADGYVKLKEDYLNKESIKLHSYQDKGMMRLNNGEVLSGDEYMERESELKEILFK
tara:strand:- start:38 stop:1300 length:1263 start_codon:yes stop_codon:yes gene_type:complete